MGLKKNCWLKVWEVKDRKEKYTEIRGSTSKKRDDGSYETDFSGFIRLVGDAHKSAENLKDGDKIQVEAFEVTNQYNKEKNVTYTNYVIYKYGDGTEKTDHTDTEKQDSKKNESVDKEAENPDDDSNLPF